VAGSFEHGNEPSGYVLSVPMEHVQYSGSLRTFILLLIQALGILNFPVLKRIFLIILLQDLCVAVFLVI